MNKETRKKYLEANKEKIKAQKKIYYEANKEKIRKEQKDWELNNRKKIRDYQKKKRLSDPLYNLKINLKNIIGKSIKNSGFKKLSRTEQILGCSYEEFKQHLESKFADWMNWSNKGNPKDGVLEANKTWDIDHIIPISTAKCEMDIIRLNRYSNLQPLCSYHNRFIKRDNI